ncbi:hypothetical protein GOZ81_19940 [Agrobacterium vitis]|uniref:hypothetical protein n=1 Tax=Agrobacterium vitis TaxID=373 RepID=UPI0012E97685|nr:hypothetical protein [Agrobacterium vitis]MVA73329.1 hypothetical protein [Agrobacterium vitis]
MSAITVSARELSANYPAMITVAAVEAVGILDNDIADASNQEVKRNLLAGSALIKYNFLSAFYRKVLSPVGLEALRVSKLHYNAAIDGSVEGTKATFSKILPATIAYLIGGPLVAAAVVLPELFKSVKEAKELTDRLAVENKNEPK